MARPKVCDTLEACDKELTELDKKRKELIERKQEIEDKDNARLGAVVRKEFRNLLPTKKGDQSKFFKELRTLYEAQLPKTNPVTEKSDKKEDSVGNTDAVKSGEVSEPITEAASEASEFQEPIPKSSDVSVVSESAAQDAGEDAGEDGSINMQNNEG